jgi:hypothetical protein
MAPHACFLIFVAIPLWVISAYFLKKSVSTTNNVLRLNREMWDEGSADRPARLRRAITRPTLGQALLIVFLSWLFVAGTYVLTVFFLAALAASMAAGPEPDDPLVRLILFLVAVPGSFILRAWITAHLLGTTLRRGSLIILIHDLIQFAVFTVPLMILIRLM